MSHWQNGFTKQGLAAMVERAPTVRMSRGQALRRGAAGETRGTARGSDGSTYTFDTDMRFMRGTYVGRDGRTRDGAFGFV